MAACLRTEIEGKDFRNAFGIRCNSVLHAGVFRDFKIGWKNSLSILWDGKTSGFKS